MMTEKINYLIMLFFAIRAIACSDEIDHAIDSIESNTRPLRAFTNQRLAMNLRWFRKRLMVNSALLINKAKNVINWSDNQNRYRDSIQRMIRDSENYIYEDEIFFKIGQYRELIIKELIASGVLIASKKKKVRSDEDVNNVRSKSYCAVKSVATLIAFSNVIWLLTHQALHISSNLENVGVCNNAVQGTLRRILKDKDCIYLNFNRYLLQTSTYQINTDVIKIVSTHTHDLKELLELIDEKAKWLMINETVTDIHTNKEDTIMLTNSVDEPKENQKDVDVLPEFNRVSKYSSAKVISQLILMAEEAGKLNYANLKDFVFEMRKWGIDFLPFFTSNEFDDNFAKYSCNIVISASDPVVRNEIIPLVNMTGSFKLDPEAYFTECIEKTAITLEENHDPENLKYYRNFGTLRGSITFYVNDSNNQRKILG